MNANNGAMVHHYDALFDSDNHNINVISITSVVLIIIIIIPILAACSH